jgi:hypothetical protein
MIEDRSQMTVVRRLRRRTENGRQRAEIRSQRTENRKQRSEAREQKTENRGHRTEILEVEIQFG